MPTPVLLTKWVFDLKVDTDSTAYSLGYMRH